MTIDTCTTSSNSNNLTSTTGKEELDQLKQDSNNNIKNTIKENNMQLTKIIEKKGTCISQRISVYDN